MNHYMVSYDLLKPGKDYDNLISRLSELGATRILFSQWELNSTASASEVCADLRQHIDSNDRLLVTGLNGYASWTGLLIPDQEFQNRLVA